MPNWCSNSVKIIGSDEDLVAIMKDLPDFSLSRVIPMPEELGTMHTGWMKIDGVEVERWRDVEVDGVKLQTPVTPEEQFELLEKYGCLDWYAWGIQNWGTKWDVDNIPWYVAPGSISVSFDTAWSPPTPVVIELSRRYPKVSVRHAYSEGGCDFAGVDVYENGGVLHSEDITPSAHRKFNEETDEDITDELYSAFLADNNLWIGG